MVREKRLRSMIVRSAVRKQHSILLLVRSLLEVGVPVHFGLLHVITVNKNAATKSTVCIFRSPKRSEGAKKKKRSTQWDLNPQSLAP